MRRVRRDNIPFAGSFVTVVTYGREPILLTAPTLFRDSWRKLSPEAWVVLPDHFQAILPCSGEQLSRIMHYFKITYSRRFRDRYRTGRVWQNRFWDHFIRDADDLRRHLDYIHFNAVRHGLATDPFEYEQSSIAKYAEAGFYDESWPRQPLTFGEENFGE